MHTIQKNYIKAKLIYDDVRERVSIEHARYVKSLKLDIMSDADSEKIIDNSIELHKKYGYDASLDTMIDAERALLSWGHQQIKTNLPKYPQFQPHEKDLDRLFARHCLPSIRGKVIDVVMRLKVEAQS